MARYTNMTDSELDGLLLLAYFPKNKEKLNLSKQDTFINTILKKISDNKLESELGENMIYFFPRDVQLANETGIYILQGFLSDIRIVKMAALKTFDDFKGMIK
jgi:hypothetical protein